MGRRNTPNKNWNSAIIQRRHLGNRELYQAKRKGTLLLIKQILAGLSGHGTSRRRGNRMLKACTRCSGNAFRASG